MKLISLTQGKFAMVDDDDYDRVNKWKWFAVRLRSGLWYARRSAYVGGKRINVHMHREVLNLSPENPRVDHWNNNGLDNQKGNLRLATNSQSAMNRKGWSKGGFKGVHNITAGGARTKPWQARIQLNGRAVHIGVFATAREAALAYNAKALELFGQFARLNPV